MRCGGAARRAKPTRDASGRTRLPCLRLRSADDRVEWHSSGFWRLERWPTVSRHGLATCRQIKGTNWNPNLPRARASRGGPVDETRRRLGARQVSSACRLVWLMTSTTRFGSRASREDPGKKNAEIIGGHVGAATVRRSYSAPTPPPHFNNVASSSEADQKRAFALDLRRGVRDNHRARAQVTSIPTRCYLARDHGDSDEKRRRHGRERHV